MNMLKKESIIKMLDKEPIEGLAFVVSYSVLPQKNGGRYVGGKLMCAGSVPFKVWSARSGEPGAFNSIVEQGIDFSGCTCYVKGTVNIYNGECSIIVNQIAKVGLDELSKAGVSEGDFFEEVYDRENLFSNIHKAISSSCSKGACEVFSSIIDKVKDRFMTEFAAINHHDNVRGGLVAHSWKVLKLSTIIKMYPALYEKVSADLLYLGAAIHDIGKIYEYYNGSISEVGKIVSHSTIGVETLVLARDEITEKLGLEFYYNLLAVVSQHHGEFGERPRTIASYVLHLLDSLEATLTDLNTLVQENKGSIRYGDYTLS